MCVCVCVFLLLLLLLLLLFVVVLYVCLLFVLCCWFMFVCLFVVLCVCVYCRYEKLLFADISAICGFKRLPHLKSSGQYCKYKHEFLSSEKQQNVC